MVTNAGFQLPALLASVESVSPSDRTLTSVPDCASTSATCIDNKRCKIRLSYMQCLIGQWDSNKVQGCYQDVHRCTQTGITDSLNCHC